MVSSHVKTFDWENDVGFGLYRRPIISVWTTANYYYKLSMKERKKKKKKNTSSLKLVFFWYRGDADVASSFLQFISSWQIKGTNLWMVFFGSPRNTYYTARITIGERIRFDRLKKNEINKKKTWWDEPERGGLRRRERVCDMCACIALLKKYGRNKKLMRARFWQVTATDDDVNIRRHWVYNTMDCGLRCRRLQNLRKKNSWKV